jgi:hypothetical protein
MTDGLRGLFLGEPEIAHALIVEAAKWGIFIHFITSS